MPAIAPTLILASTSPYRRELLARLGVPFTPLPPQVDERALDHDSLSPAELAPLLARAKAGSLREDHPAATIVGCDQVCACEREILHKPGDAPSACRQLGRLSGRTHQLITAVALLHRGQTLEHVDVTTLHMRSLAEQEIARYVAADQPYDCAGSYKLEQRGIALFDRIDSDDHTAITGLPLIAVARLLRQCGFVVP